MNDIQILALVIAGSGLLIFLTSVPLILGRIPPNDVYGIRTRSAFASESDWYRINRIGGRYFATSGIVILLTGAVGFFLTGSAFHSYSLISTAITLLVVIGPCVRLCTLKPSDHDRHDT